METSITTLAHPQRELFSTLRRLARPRELSAAKCDLCSAAIGVDHEHVLELPNRRLLCSCQACGVLFSDSHNGRFRRVPRRSELLSDFQLADATWNSLLIPINLAFFYRDSLANRLAGMYPSPAGATESLLQFDSWRELSMGNLVLNELLPDVEALLVNRMGAARDYYRVSIDRCYELVGLIRIHWRGLSGGTKVWQEVSVFLESLKTAHADRRIHA